jgi:uncharacterized protein (TIGR02118 family)
MIKLIYCISKRADIEPAEFYSYWLEQHGPLVKSVAADIGACRYVQSHTVLPAVNEMFQAGRGLESPYDGVTEVWWASMEDFERGTGTPEGQAASAKLLEDEAGFIDFSHSKVFMTEEHEIF